jgi:hypothetical protein
VFIRAYVSSRFQAFILLLKKSQFFYWYFIYSYFNCIRSKIKNLSKPKPKFENCCYNRQYTMHHNFNPLPPALWFRFLISNNYYFRVLRKI